MGTLHIFTIVKAADENASDAGNIALWTARFGSQAYVRRLSFIANSAVSGAGTPNNGNIQVTINGVPGSARLQTDPGLTAGENTSVAPVVIPYGATLGVEVAKYGAGILIPGGTISVEVILD